MRGSPNEVYQRVEIIVDLFLLYAYAKHVSQKFSQHRDPMLDTSSSTIKILLLVPSSLS